VKLGHSTHAAAASVRVVTQEPPARVRRVRRAPVDESPTGAESLAIASAQAVIRPSFSPCSGATPRSASAFINPGFEGYGPLAMIMGQGALAANQHASKFRRLMDANRSWFTLSPCHDGTFYYQPNRDNAGYGADSRLSASAVTAFILSTPKQNLLVTRPAAKR